MSLEESAGGGKCSGYCVYGSVRRTDESPYLITGERVNHELDAVLLGLNKDSPKWLVRAAKYLADRFPIIYKFTMP